MMIDSFLSAFFPFFGILIKVLLGIPVYNGRFLQNSPSKIDTPIEEKLETLVEVESRTATKVMNEKSAGAADEKAAGATDEKVVRATDERTADRIHKQNLEESAQQELFQVVFSDDIFLLNDPAADWYRSLKAYPHENYIQFAVKY